MQLTKEEKTFLKMAKDPEARKALLERLAKLELLSAFLAAESGTKPIN